jgi:hypothetical protein
MPYGGVQAQMMGAGMPQQPVYPQASMINVQQQHRVFAPGTATKQKRKDKKVVVLPEMQGLGLPQGGSQHQLPFYGTGPSVVQGQSTLVQGQPQSFQFASAQYGYAPQAQFHPQHQQQPQFVPPQPQLAVASIHQQQQQPQFIPPQPTAPVVQAHAQDTVLSGTLDQGTSVVTVGAQQAPVAKAKKVWCWKCADNTHASKDWKFKHYCYICDKIAHPTVRCPVLKAPRPTAYVTGSGLLETFFTALPDSVVREDLTPTNSPVARIIVTGDVVPADVIARQVARRCSESPGWKWEAVPYGEKEFLISVPSFDDLNRMDGIQVGVPDSNSSIGITTWQSAEVQHKVELEQVWLHVEGVPHTLRHFLGLWAVGSLLGKTLDVDLLSLRRRGVVRVLVAMLNSSVLDRTVSEPGSYAISDAVVKLKSFEFSFRREPADFVPEPDFVPFLWEKKNDGNDEGGAAGPDDDDAMDTLDGRIGAMVSPAPPTQPSGSGGVSSSGAQVASIVFAVTR